MKSEYEFINDLTNELSKRGLSVKKEVKDPKSGAFGMIADVVVNEGGNAVVIEVKNNGKNGVIGFGVANQLRNLAKISSENNAQMILATSAAINPIEREILSSENNLSIFENAEVKSLANEIQAKLSALKHMTKNDLNQNNT